MTKAIIFDFWGTIVETGVFPSPVRQVKMILRIDMPFSEFIMRFEKALMTKKFENLNDAFREVCTEFGVNPPEFVYDKLIGLWNKNRLLAKPYPETVSVLESLKGKYKLILLSNSDCFSIDPLLDKYDLRKYFDIINVSYETGQLKTDAATIQNILSELKIQPSDAVMVGDSLESDIIPAKNAGVKAILIDRRNRREYEDKITDLNELEGHLN